MLERLSMRKHRVVREIPHFAEVNVNKVVILYGIVLIQLACCSFLYTLVRKLHNKFFFLPSLMLTLTVSHVTLTVELLIVLPRSGDEACTAASRGL